MIPSCCDCSQRGPLTLNHLPAVIDVAPRGRNSVDRRSFQSCRIEPSSNIELALQYNERDSKMVLTWDCARTAGYFQGF